MTATVDTAADPGPASDEHDLRASATHGALWTMAQNFGARIVTTVVFVLLARIVGVEVVGLAALATFFVEAGRVLVDQGVSQAIVQHRDLRREHLDTAFWTATALGGGLALLTVALAPTLARLLGSPELDEALRPLALVFVLAALGTTHAGLLTRNLQFRAVAAARIAGVAAGGVAGVVLGLAGAGVMALVVLQVANAAVTTSVLWIVGRWRPGPHWSADRFGELRRFAVPVVGVQLVDFLNGNGDNLLIGALLGERVLGAYAIAYRVFSVALEVVGTTVAQVAFPAFARLGADRHRLGAAYLEAMRLTNAAGVPLFLVVAVFADRVVALGFGAGYADAGPMLRALSVVGALYLGGWFVRAVLYATGHPSWELGFQVVSAASKLTGFALVLAAGGSVTDAIAAQAAMTVVLLAAALTLARRAAGVGVRAQATVLVLPWSAGLAAAAVLVLTGRALPAGTHPGLVLGYQAVCGACVYGAAVAVNGAAVLADLGRTVRTVLRRAR